MTVCIVLFTCESGGITVTIAQSPKITYTVHHYTHQINPVCCQPQRFHEPTLF